MPQRNRRTFFLHSLLQDNLDISNCYCVQRHDPVFTMDHQVSKEIPFTADATNLVLIEYRNYVEAAYHPILCEHQEEGKSGNFQLVTEPTEKGEGKIERKTVYKFIQDQLEEKHLRGYWTIERPNIAQEEKADSVQDGDEDDTQDAICSIPVFQYGTLGLEVYPRGNDTIKLVQQTAPFSQLFPWLTVMCARLGTGDIRDMLKACLLRNKGRTIMPKLSGSASYDGTKKFRWSLRGPTIEPDSEAGSGGRQALKKLKSLFQK